MGLGERGNGLVVVFEGLLDESTLVVGPDVVRVDRQRFVRPVQCVVELSLKAAQVGQVHQVRSIVRFQVAGRCIVFASPIETFAEPEKVAERGVRRVGLVVDSQCQREAPFDVGGRRVLPPKPFVPARTTPRPAAKRADAVGRRILYRLREVQ